MFATDGLVTLIDLDGVAPYGKRLPYFTPKYGLDAEPVASLEYDLTCLAATLYHLAAGTTATDGDITDSCVSSQALCPRLQASYKLPRETRTTLRLSSHWHAWQLRIWQQFGNSS